MGKDFNLDNEAIHRGEAKDLLKMKLSGKDTSLSKTDILNLVHELELYQFELELQNEELKRSNNAASEAAEKYSTLYDFAPSGFFTFSREGDILELNIRASEMLGKPRARLINSRFGFFLTEDSKIIFHLFQEQLFSDKKNNICEITLSVNGKTTVHVRLTGIVSRNQEQCFVTAVDITDLRLTKSNLRKSEHFLKSTIDSISSGIVVLDHNLNIVSANKAWFSFGQMGGGYRTRYRGQLF